MVLWIGVDDTDSLRGMCTTFLATEFVRELTQDYDLIGYPRLVRLNPNIPWKTRGNGAIALSIGQGIGRSFVVGQFNGNVVRAFPRGVEKGEPSELLERLSPLVETWSDLEDPRTDPGLVVLRQKPSSSLYWRAVRDIVSMQDAERSIRGLGAMRKWKGGRGIIGASAACAWRPRDRTWEVLAYRERTRWGSPREISERSVIRMDRSFPSTFNNYDYEERRIVIAPSTPCPVLCGIRGDRPTALPRALRIVRGERPERWLLFETNQGTDDHVSPKCLGRPRTTGRFPGRVKLAPRSIPGGHVVFQLEDRQVIAYEPSKAFRAIVRGLLPGDEVVVIGAVRETPRTINLEKIRIDSLQSLKIKVANPMCPSCGIHMKSSGRDTAYRCRRCRRSAPRSSATFAWVRRSLRPGWYEPPVGSRRHLSKPLKRGAPGSHRLRGRDA